MTHKARILNPLNSRPFARFLAITSGMIPALLAATLALTGCSSVKTTVDKGPITARTFSFLNMGPRQTPSYAEARKEAHAMIQQAIIKNLAAKGVSQVPAGGDITVAYIVILGNNVSTTSLNEYFGYGPDAEALLEKVHKQETQTSEQRGYFEQGTLVIDILDPKTSKILDRRTISAQILRNLPMEQRAERVQSIVDQALAPLQIAH